MIDNRATLKSFDQWPPDIGIDSYYSDKWRVIYCGDCREILSSLFGVSAIVTDPPYELGFMGKSWDSKGVSFQPATWSIIQASCKSGAPLLSFGGTRTYHRIAVAIEDAGWELRDTIMWVYGSGFPKSLDISKAIDKQFGAEREVIGRRTDGRYAYAFNGTANRPTGAPAGSQDAERIGGFVSDKSQLTSPATPESKLWEGYGTALKPAYEPIILAMNPLNGTFANNALKEGVAGLNIDGCRIPMNGDVIHTPQSNPDNRRGVVGTDLGITRSGVGKFQESQRLSVEKANDKGRFPANFCHDGSQEVMELFPDAGKGNGGKPYNYVGREYNNKDTSMFNGDKPQAPSNFNGSGSAARFFYCAKASRSERDAGLDGDNKPIALNTGLAHNVATLGRETMYKNNHPTVKPLALMEYLVKLVKMPQYNLVLDPFCGSGTTLLACASLGVRSVGIDSDIHSCEIAANRWATDAVERIKRGEY